MWNEWRLWWNSTMRPNGCMTFMFCNVRKPRWVTWGRRHGRREKTRCTAKYLCLWVHDADPLLVDDDPDLVRPTGFKGLLQWDTWTLSPVARSLYHGRSFLVQMTYSNIKEGAAECRPCCNGFQEHASGLLRCDSALLAIGVDDVLRDEGDKRVKNKVQTVWFNKWGVFCASLTVFQSSAVMNLIWSAGTRSPSSLGISSNRVLSESTKALKRSPPRSVMSSFVQSW